MKSRNMVLIALLAGIGWGLKGEAKDMQHFKKPSREELKKKLTPEQFKVTQDEGTEKAFANAYWNNKEPGIYVDIVSGEPLFSSLDKFESGTGWPSFIRPLAKENIVERDDSKFFMKRTEVRSRHGDSHLGHVFDDGPPPTGLRYCLNSAALRFVPASKLEEEGYGEFAKLFADRKPKREAIAIFAGGCFWCMEPPFEKMEGVSEVISGYIGGEKPDPTYEEVSSGKTGHVEAVKVVYDPDKVSYEQLLDVFWQNINPVDAGGQFVDRGKQYRSAIFYQNEAEAAAAKKSRDALAESGKFKEKIATEIFPASQFYEAENYHQDYYRKNPIRYKFYRMNSGRDEFIESHWKKKK